MPTPTDRELEELKADLRHALARGWVLESSERTILSLIYSYEERGRALERFGRIADYWIDATPGGDPVVLCDLGGTLGESWDLTIGDFRKARSLSPTPGGGE